MGTSQGGIIGAPAGCFRSRDAVAERARTCLAGKGYYLPSAGEQPSPVRNYLSARVSSRSIVRSR
jgi:hypothetical protein